MLLVASETLSRTAIACFFYLIANGWGVLNFDYDPIEAINCAKFLGLAYLCHSAYFITVGAWTMHLYIRAILIIFYVANTYKIAKRTSTSLSLLSRNEGYLRITNLHNQFRAAIALKR